MDFVETEEQQMLREAVGAIAAKFGHEYYVEKAHADERDRRAVGRAVAEGGFLGVNVPDEYGGGGMGITELAIVHEELAANGCPLLLLVVSPAICATIIAQFGTEEQKQTVAAALRHRRAQDGLRHHRARRRLELAQPDRHRGHADGDVYRLSTDRSTTSRASTSAEAVLVVTRTGVDEDTGRGRLSLFVVDLDSPGLDKTLIPVEIVAPEKQYTLFFDNVQVAADRLHRHRGRRPAPGVRRD